MNQNEMGFDEYKEGFIARIDGKFLNDNPYQKHAKLASKIHKFRGWAEGWIEADNIIKEES
jgi:hypothetical protein